jgi:myo-inositol 2-dehydrogenase / D-chiro-inositol 1-dehydrogenase
MPQDLSGVGVTAALGRLRVGIAGLGRLGRRHAENLALRTTGAQLVAACSPIAAECEAAAKDLGVPVTFAHFDELLHADGIDAVVLVTPTALHADQVITALEAGKHVFVEKPLALDLADCERVEAVARRHPAQVAMVGFVRRFDPSYQHAAQAIADGRIGKPFLVRSQTCDRTDTSGMVLRYAPASGGLFMDCSVHDIDLARWLLGNPKAQRVFATGTVAVHQGLEAIGDVDNGIAVVEFEGGSRAVIYASRTFAHGHETSTEIIGSAGKLTVGVGAARDRVVTSDMHGVRHEAVADFFERFESAFQREMQAFVDACRGAAATGLTLADATEATRVGAAITRALHSGQVETV